jgi:hypothetical protein
MVSLTDVSDPGSPVDSEPIGTQNIDEFFEFLTA